MADRQTSHGVTPERRNTARTSLKLPRPKLGRPPRASFLAAVVALIAGAWGRPALAADQAADGRWVSAWHASATPGGTFNSQDCPSDVGLSGQTVRNIVRLSTGGSSVRVRISNAGGSEPLRVGAASIAASAGGAATVAGSSKPLRFAGQASIVIAAGGEAVSDPVAMNVQALQTLAVNIHLPANTGPATQHYFAAQDSFLAAGNQTGAGADKQFTRKISCWMFLSGVDVKAPPNVVGTLIALGDSITDGYLSTKNTNQRYPDFLAQRLASRKGQTLSVVNAGIIGNELLTVRPQLQFGYPVPARLARDVLTQPGARAVILLAGINDIGDRSAKAADLIPVYQQIIQAAHAAGLKIYGGTLVPFAGSTGTYKGDYGTAKGEQERQKLNTWIRTSGAFDGVIDFDKAVRDPADPSRLLPAYDADKLHPNDAGYQAMANAVNLDAIIGDVLKGTSP
ncbi:MULTISPECIES: SGNH/GDSL hydrolase family protein [Sorangium]|uniref:Lipase n=1 Tax=Sorangium cellulosum TaxID=56 RepID=A0A4V0NGW6_SORCE|nr:MULTISPECIES: SGNH/GDSL hydrolase family protein [Sorangium]AUX34602.1 lipase [Sorangium cellulosum]WCQ93914.1 lysophospholipase L1-like esterase [Sorangium sp. Soce836]